MKQQHSLPLIETKLVGETLRFLKTPAQRNKYLKQLVKEREKQKLKDEKELFHSKQQVLQHSKKKFLSLLKSRNPEVSFMKFRPISKPLNLLRMCAELKISDKASKSVDIDEIIESNRSSKSEKTKQSSSQQIDHSVHVQHFRDDSTPKQRGTLQFLTTHQLIKTTIPPQVKIDKCSSKSQSNPQTPRQPKITSIRKLPLNELEQQLDQLKQINQDVQVQTGVLCRVPSQILNRNGILLPSSKHHIKIQQQSACWEDDNSSLASHTELKLDAIYNGSKHLKRDHKNYEHKKVEYQQESIKLFYKKIYCKL